MKKPIIPKALRRLVIVLACAVVVALAFTLWLVDVQWLITPDAEMGLYGINKSITGHYHKMSSLAVKVVGCEGEEIGYVSRLVGKRGDEVMIADGYVKVNGAKIKEVDAACCSFVVSKETTYKMLHEMERVAGWKVNTGDTIVMKLNAVKDEWRLYLRVPLLKNMPDLRLYPYRSEVHWNGYNWGPIKLPSAGDTIVLNYENYVKYGDLIRRYEGTEVTKDGSEYVFKESYICLIGDDRDVSLDSRYYGLVPESRVMGNITTKLW